MVQYLRFSSDSITTGNYGEFNPWREDPFTTFSETSHESPHIHDIVGPEVTNLFFTQNTKSKG
jgi:hypothetical protein